MINIVLICLTYLLVFYLCVRKIVHELYFDAHLQISDLESQEQSLVTRKEKLCEERRDLEVESREIFTLYEITKDSGS